MVSLRNMDKKKLAFGLGVVMLTLILFSTFSIVSAITGNVIFAFCIVITLAVLYVAGKKGWNYGVSK